MNKGRGGRRWRAAPPRPRIHPSDLIRFLKEVALIHPRPTLRGWRRYRPLIACFHVRLFVYSAHRFMRLASTSAEEFKNLCVETQKTPVNTSVLSLLNSSKQVQNEINCHYQTLTNKGLQRSGRKVGFSARNDGKSIGKHPQTSANLLLPDVVTSTLIYVSH